MKNKYGLGTLVSYQNLIWKVVEVWDIGFIASVTGKILNDHKYIITNIPEQKIAIANESEIEAVNGPDTTEVLPKVATLNKKSK